MFGLRALHASVASPMVMSIAESRIANELPNLFVFGVPHVLGQRAHVLWSYPREKTGQTCFLMTTETSGSAAHLPALARPRFRRRAGNQVLGQMGSGKWRMENWRPAIPGSVVSW